jgi:hypothetical protein
MRFPRTLLGLAACTVLIAMLAACGGGNSSNFKTTTGTPPPPPTGNNYTTCASTEGSSQLVPNWQSQLFYSNYQSAISALVNHVSTASYASRIGYIRIGLGKGGEINLPSGWDNSSSGACYGGYTGKWNYTAGSPSASWNTYLQSMVQFENSLDSPIPLLVSITPITDIGIEPDDFIAQVAFQDGINYGNQGLEASDITNFQSNQPCAGDWCNLFNLYPASIRELQTLGQSCPQGTSCSGQQGSTGPLPPLLQFATTQVPTPANDLEIYYQDWLVAYDPTNSANAQYGSSYASAIQSAAQVAKMQVLFPDPTNGDIAQYVLSQSVATGVVIDVDWSDFDPGNGNASGNYDWAITDASINQWLGVMSSNQKVNLVLQNTTYGGNNCSGGSGIGSNGSDSSGNCAMPSWMWTVLQ